MPKGFLKRVYGIIKQADIILEIVDARFVEETRNKRLEERVKKAGKQLIIVINKADLVGKKNLLSFKQALPFPSVFLTVKNHKGLRWLKEEIGKLSEKKKTIIGAIGYPNTGKSSVINFLAGRKAARVSSKAGFTRGEQFVRVSEKILLIDGPGIIPFEERDAYALAILGAKNPEQLEDAELGGIKLIEFLQQKFPEKITQILGQNFPLSAEELLEKIAIKWNKKLKGNLPDTESTAKILLKKWQKGEI